MSPSPRARCVGLMVGLGGVLAERHDRVERQPVRALVAHRALELPRHLLFGHPDREPVQRPRSNAASVIACAGRIAARSSSSFTGAQRLHHVGRRHQLDLVVRAPPHSDRVRPTVTSSASNPSRPTPSSNPAAAPRAADSRYVSPLQVGHLAAGLLRVPAVGEEQRAVATDQDLSVRSGEAGQVPRVQQPGDEQRIDTQLVQARGERAPPHVVIHGIASSAR